MSVVLNVLITPPPPCVKIILLSQKQLTANQAIEPVYLYFYCSHIWSGNNPDSVYYHELKFNSFYRAYMT